MWYRRLYGGTMTCFQKEKQEKGEEREGGMTYPRINDGTKLYKPPLERVRESAVVSLFSPATQTPRAVPPQKLISPVDSAVFNKRSQVVLPVALQPT